MLLALLLGLMAGLPAQAHAETVGAFNVEGGARGTDYSYDGGVLSILTDAPLTVSMANPGETTNSDRIVVPSSNKAADVTLAGVNIELSDDYGCAFEIKLLASAKLTLAKGSANSLVSGCRRAGLEVCDDASLTIGGEGSLEAKCLGDDAYGAGIGGGYNGYVGSVEITGGTVTASCESSAETGAAYGAGIGSGREGSRGRIQISGGSVAASCESGGRYGIARGAGIGGGGWGSVDSVVITGGKVIASSESIGGGDGAGIGGGYCDYCDGSGVSVAISGGRIEAESGSSAAIDSEAKITGGLFAADSCADGMVYGVRPFAGCAVFDSPFDDKAIYPYAVAAPAGDFLVMGGDGPGEDYSYDDCETLRIKSDAPLTVFMKDPAATTNADRIVVPSSNKAADVTLAGVKIDVSGDASACAFAIEPDASAKLTLAEGSANSLVSGANRAGLEIPVGASVDIGGEGSLLAKCFSKSETRGAGIGGAHNGSAGIIKITGGTVTASCESANGDACGAGIGGGQAGSGGSIEVSGGMVTASCMAARSSARGAGIGGGLDGSAGSIKIIGGTVNASCEAPSRGGYGSGVGSGMYGSGGSVSISGGAVSASCKSTYGYLAGPGIGAGYDGSDLAVSITGGVFSKGDVGAGTVCDGKLAAGFVVRDNPMAGKEAYPYAVAALTGDFAVMGGASGKDYSYEGGVLSMLTGAPMAVSMKDGVPQTKADRIVVPSSNKAANITLAGIDIDASGSAWVCAFTIESGVSAKLTLAKGSDNSLVSGMYSAGLGVPEGASVSIGGEGSLTAKCFSEYGARGAGIGGGSGGSAGSIKITGGTVTASCESSAEMGAAEGAGIGGGSRGSGGTVEISGGTVTASSKGSFDVSGAGIGGGYKGSAGSVKISGGTVTASCESGMSSSGAGIGGGCGSDGSGGSVEVTGGTVTALCKSTAAGDAACGAGIGGGFENSSVAVTISGGEVIASCESAVTSAYGAGIGGGWKGSGGSVAITGGSVSASCEAPGGKALGADIGDGDSYAGDSVAVSVTGGAFASSDAAADIAADKVCGVSVGTPDALRAVAVNQDPVTMAAYPVAVYPKKAYSLSLSPEGGLVYDGASLDAGDFVLSAEGSPFDPADVPGLVSFEHKDASASNYAQGLPKDAGAYNVRAALPKKVVEEGGAPVCYVAQPAEASVEIARRPLSATVKAGDASATREYDGTASFSGVALELSGVLVGDSEKVSATAEGSAIADGAPDASTGAGKAFSASSIELAGAAKGNYSLAAGDVKGVVTIVPKPISVSSASVASKAYDGTTDATVSAVGFDGLVQGESLALGKDCTATGTFDDLSAREGKPVRVTVALEQTPAAANYELSSGLVDGKASISRRPIAAVSATVEPKPYDGATGATVSAVEFKDFVPGESLAMGADYTAVGEFEDPSAYAGKKVLVKVSLVPDGPVSKNYELAEEGSSVPAVGEILRAESSLGLAVGGGAGGQGASFSYGETVSFTVSPQIAIAPAARSAARPELRLYAVAADGSEEPLCDPVPVVEGKPATAFYDTREKLLPVGGSTVRARVSGLANLEDAFEDVRVVVEPAPVFLSWSGAEGRVFGDGLEVSASPVGTLPGDDLRAEVSGGAESGAGGPYTATAALAGAHAAFYRIEGSATASYSIAKAPALDLGVPAAMPRLCPGATAEVDLAALLPEGERRASFEVASFTREGLVSAEVDASGVLTLTSDAPASAERDEVVVRAEDMRNHEDSKVVVTVVYSDKPVAKILGATAADGLVYDGSPQVGFTGKPVASFEGGSYEGPFELLYVGTGGTSYGPTPDAPTRAGAYAVTLSVPEAEPSCVGSVALGFSIGRAPLFVRANDAEAVYGELAKAAGVSFEGFAPGEGPGDLSGELALELEGYAPGSPAGSYPVVPSGLSSGDYAISFVPGELSVAPRPLSAKVDERDPSASRSYDGTAAFSGVALLLEGVLPGDEASAVADGAAERALAGEGLAFEASAVRLLGADAASYSLPPEGVEGRVSISRAPLTVRAADASMVAGGPLVELGFELSGLAACDEVLAPPALSVEGGASAPGSYPIVPSGISVTNQGCYEVAYENGTLSVLAPGGGQPGDDQRPGGGEGEASGSGGALRPLPAPGGAQAGAALAPTGDPLSSASAAAGAVALVAGLAAALAAGRRARMRG